MPRALSDPRNKRQNRQKTVRRQEPAQYESWQVDEVLRRISDGQTPLKIGSDPEMPSHQTIAQWVRHDRNFARRYYQAWKRGCEAMAEQIVEIADKVEPDRESLGQAKLQIDARKWFLEVMAPRLGFFSAEQLDADAQRPSDDTTRAQRVASLLENAKWRRNKQEEEDEWE